MDIPLFVKRPFLSSDTAYFLYMFCSRVFVLWLTESIASVYLYVCCAIADLGFAFFRSPDNKKNRDCTDMHHPSLEAAIFSPTQSCPTKTILHIRLQTMRLPHLLPLIKIIKSRRKEMHFSLCLLAKCLDKAEHVLLLPTICSYKYFFKTLNRKIDLSSLTFSILYQLYPQLCLYAD